MSTGVDLTAAVGAVDSTDVSGVPAAAVGVGLVGSADLTGCGVAIGAELLTVCAGSAAWVDGRIGAADLPGVVGRVELAVFGVA